MHIKTVGSFHRQRSLEKDMSKPLLFYILQKKRKKEKPVESKKEKDFNATLKNSEIISMTMEKNRPKFPSACSKRAFYLLTEKDLSQKA